MNFDFLGIPKSLLSSIKNIVNFRCPCCCYRPSYGPIVNVFLVERKKPWFAADQRDMATMSSERFSLLLAQYAKHHRAPVAHGQGLVDRLLRKGRIHDHTILERKIRCFS